MINTYNMHIMWRIQINTSKMYIFIDKKLQKYTKLQLFQFKSFT